MSRKIKLQTEYKDNDFMKGFSRCPKCKNGYLYLRKNGRDNSQFIGCSNFPNCRYTENIDIKVKRVKK